MNSANTTSSRLLAWYKSPALRTAAAVIAGCSFFLAVCVLNTWIAEDAYITFRSIEQFMHGNGLRWNPHERVQAFTHPLWFLVLSLVRLFSRDVYLNAILLSYAACLAMVLVLLKLSRTRSSWLLVGILLLTASKGFVDYTTSGLENPLSFLLIALFFWIYFRPTSSGGDRPVFASRLTWLVLSYAFALLTRIDLGVLLTPPLLFAFWQHRRIGITNLLGVAARGLLPFLMWTAFSVFYYGFPVPNTYYAKLNTGIPGAVLWQQGLHYIANAWTWDASIPVIILVSLLIAGMTGKRSELFAATGILLSVLYVISIGGDFMFARMLTPAYLAAVILILRQNIACPAVIGLLITGGILINSHAPPKISRDYRALFVRQQGITDEKGFYFPASNLWMYKFYVQDLHRKAAFPFHPLTRCGYRAALEKQKVVVWSNIGYYGYWSGLDTIIVDDLALADPLLSKLPAVPGWFIGHFQRAIPEGYLESLRSGSNIIADPSIRGLYEDIRLVSQAPLLDPRRIGAIIRLNFRRSGL